MPVTTTRRLAGFRFETKAPPLPEMLPRMDIAVFVGIASSGPLHVPVAVEDITHFQAIFGDDVPLALDLDTTETIFGYLAPAVRAFFRNGGRRCWIIRVADDARAISNNFPLPGLTSVTFDDSGKPQDVQPAFAPARSEGSWSDNLEIAPALVNNYLGSVLSVADGGKTIVFDSISRNLLQAGDLVLLRLPQSLTGLNNDYTVFCSVQSARAESGSSGLNSVRITADRALWTSPLTGTAVVAAGHFFNPGPNQSVNGVKIDKAVPDNDLLGFAITASETPVAGAAVWLKVPTGQVLLSVQEIANTSVRGTPVYIPDTFPSTIKPADNKSSIGTLEVCTFELWVNNGGDDFERLRGLGFQQSHPQFWASIANDKDYYSTLLKQFDEGRPIGDTTRFPVAGSGQNGWYFPAGMAVDPIAYAKHLPNIDESTYERNGLATFGARFFVDEDLVAPSTMTVINEADFYRYESATPRPLKGIHAALRIGEATMIAVPDVVHRQWQIEAVPAPPAPLNAKEEPVVVDWSEFLRCGFRVPQAPTFKVDQNKQAWVSETPFTLQWNKQDGVTFTLQQGRAYDFSDAVTVYTGDAVEYPVDNLTDGDYYYRVRAETTDELSAWSPGVAVRISAATRLVISSRDPFSFDDLLVVHRALFRMCAGRGDLIGIMSLPEHFRSQDARQYLEILRSHNSPDIPVGRGISTATDGLEGPAFSYVALYHPWITSREDDVQNVYRSTPPDGIVSGILAQVALDSGAWVAPANRYYQGVVDLTDTILPDDWLPMLNLQVNVVRHEPRGFVTLSEDTLSDDDDWRPISVRRLMILIRRLALRLGASYVFEPNDDAFRRAVQRGFEALLDRMYQRGAFAGATASDSYRVDTGSTLNTPQSVDEGRFIVEIRVSPARPMSFLTIRLVQTADDSYVTEVR